MDSAKITWHVNDEENTEEKLQDNRQLTREPGEKLELDENGPKSLIMEIYPWIWEFKKMCRSSLAQRSFSSLKKLMTFYVRNVRSSVNECRTKPLRAEKLKNSIGESLLFFLYYYRDVGELKDRDYYLIIMSDLLAMYIDMELKASKKGEEHSSKISTRLSFYLHVYLENSAEHLLDTLLKIHFMNPNYHEILDPVVTKIFKIIDDHPTSSIMYVRYFLAYRLWKKLNKDVAVRNQINMIALTSLGIVPLDFPPFIVESVLPEVPKSQKISTKFLLLQKFEVEKSCGEFLSFCNNERGMSSATTEDKSSPTSIIVSLPEDKSDCRELITNKTSLSVVTSQVTSIENTSMNKISIDNSTDRQSATKTAISSNVSSLRRRKKSKDIVFIDLTGESIKEKVIRNKRTRRKLMWLEKVRNRISAKIMARKSSPPEDPSKLEDSLDLQSLQISGPRSPSSKMEIHSPEKVSEEKEESRCEDESIIEVSRVSSRETVHEASSTVTNGLVNKSPYSFEWNEPESRQNERNRAEVDDGRVIEETTCSQSAEIVSNEAERSTLPADNSATDQYPKSVKIDDTRELEPQENAELVETSEKCQRMTKEEVKDERHFEAPVEPAIKPEDVTIARCEIINDTTVSYETELRVAEYASEISLTSDEQSEPRKIGDSEFQDNIDGLSLLASVSQRISDLGTTSEPGTTVNTMELIKVKNYASLANLNAIEEPEISRSLFPSFPNDSSALTADGIADIYPEDAMDKVAYQVEVTSTNETDPYGVCDQLSQLVSFSSHEETRCNPQAQPTNVLPPVEVANPVEKDDANVILNGETVVLFQKSPNSNLYIINKAVENRDHASEEVANQLRDVADHANENAAYSYEIYDSIYRSKATTYEISQYNRELSSQESRRGIIVKSDKTGEANKGYEPSELSKSGKNKVLDAGDDKSRIKRKHGSSSIPRRRRIKQEYNGCGSSMPARLKSNYGIQECPQEHPDAAHSIHIPVSAPIYTKYSSSPELYLPCHKNCSSITCGLPVNPATALHSHTGKSTAGNSHCSCLNCAYGIVTHCTECIIPNGEARGTSMEANGYYVPLHSGQKSVVQDCNRSNVDKTLAKIYDDQIVYKLEQKILEEDTLNGVKYEPKEIYRAELDNKLPLKKRFKAIMSMSFVENVPIKCEKMQSYPGTPMLSIAALENGQESNDQNSNATNCNKNSLDPASKHPTRGESHLSSQQSREMIRRDYRKDMMMMLPPTVGSSYQNGHRANGTKRKRGTSLNNSDAKDHEGNYHCPKKNTSSGKHRETKSQARPSEKVKEPEIVPAKKNSTRKTRSSKRNVPKVNYIYADGDSDWNPSGGVAGNAVTKRKRKKASR